MDALITWMRGPQTLAAALGRVLVPRALLFAVVATAVLVGQAMTVDPTASQVAPLPTPAPTWSPADRAAQPDCVPVQGWPEGKPARDVVVSRAADGRVLRLAFDRAWALNHNASEADDLWVLGVCP